MKVELGDIDVNNDLLNTGMCVPPPVEASLEFEAPQIERVEAPVAEASVEQAFVLAAAPSSMEAS